MNTSDYPHKALIAGADPDAPTAMVFLDTGSDRLADLGDGPCAAMAHCLAQHGHVLLLAKDAATLDRIHAAVLMVIGALVESDTGPRGTVQ
jgi:hypothetical protein